MLATLGDLIDDVIVRLDGPIRSATDTPSTITRRRGGSAANVAATAGSSRFPARFLGQVGDDPIGATLIAALDDAGVDTQFVRRRGTTGTIVVLVDSDGERSMLTDRGTSIDLDDPRPEWLDGVTTLHVPLYSMFDGNMAATATTLVGWAHDREVRVSVDLSSAALIDRVGPATVRDVVEQLRPGVVFANSDEADATLLSTWRLDAISVVKNGARPAVLALPSGRPTTPSSPSSPSSPSNTGREILAIPAIEIPDLDDSTGAGDAFAAGFLGRRDWFQDPVEACIHGHRTAHRVLSGNRS